WLSSWSGPPTTTSHPRGGSRPASPWRRFSPSPISPAGFAPGSGPPPRCGYGRLERVSFCRWPARCSGRCGGDSRSVSRRQERERRALGEPELRFLDGLDLEHATRVARWGGDRDGQRDLLTWREVGGQPEALVAEPGGYRRAGAAVEVH